MEVRNLSPVPRSLCCTTTALYRRPSWVSLLLPLCIAALLLLEVPAVVRADDECSALPQVANADVTAMSALNDSSELVMTCHPGYNLSTSMKRVCETNGTSAGNWVGDQHCIPLENFCPLLSAGDGAALYLDRRRVGSSAVVICNSTGAITIISVRPVCQYNSTTKTAEWSATAACSVKMATPSNSSGTSVVAVALGAVLASTLLTVLAFSIYLRHQTPAVFSVATTGPQDKAREEGEDMGRPHSHSNVSETLSNTSPSMSGSSSFPARRPLSVQGAIVPEPSVPPKSTTLFMQDPTLSPNTTPTANGDVETVRDGGRRKLTLPDRLAAFQDRVTGNRDKKESPESLTTRLSGSTQGTTKWARALSLGEAHLAPIPMIISKIRSSLRRRSKSWFPSDASSNKTDVEASKPGETSADMSQEAEDSQAPPSQGQAPCRTRLGSSDLLLSNMASSLANSRLTLDIDEEVESIYADAPSLLQMNPAPMGPTSFSLGCANPSFPDSPGLGVKLTMEGNFIEMASMQSGNAVATGSPGSPMMSMAVDRANVMDEIEADSMYDCCTITTSGAGGAQVAGNSPLPSDQSAQPDDDDLYSSLPPAVLQHMKQAREEDKKTMTNLGFEDEENIYSDFGNDDAQGRYSEPPAPAPDRRDSLASEKNIYESGESLPPSLSGAGQASRVHRHVPQG